MEALLELYREPYDPRRPVVCMDEASKQLIAETRMAVPMQASQPVRYDYEYERKGGLQSVVVLRTATRMAEGVCARATHNARLGVVYPAAPGPLLPRGAVRAVGAR